MREHFITILRIILFLELIVQHWKMFLHNNKVQGSKMTSKLFWIFGNFTNIFTQQVELIVQHWKMFSHNYKVQGSKMTSKLFWIGRINCPTLENVFTQLQGSRFKDDFKTDLNIWQFYQHLYTTGRINCPTLENVFTQLQGSRFRDDFKTVLNIWQFYQHLYTTGKINCPTLENVFTQLQGFKVQRWLQNCFEYLAILIYTTIYLTGSPNRLSVNMRSKNCLLPKSSVLSNNLCIYWWNMFSVCIWLAWAKVKADLTLSGRSFYKLRSSNTNSIKLEMYWSHRSTNNFP